MHLVWNGTDLFFRSKIFDLETFRSIWDSAWGEMGYGHLALVARLLHAAKRFSSNVLQYIIPFTHTVLAFIF